MPHTMLVLPSLTSADPSAVEIFPEMKHMISILTLKIINLQNNE